MICQTKWPHIIAWKLSLREMPIFLKKTLRALGKALVSEKVVSTLRYLGYYLTWLWMAIVKNIKATKGWWWWRERYRLYNTIIILNWCSLYWSHYLNSNDVLFEPSISLMCKHHRDASISIFVTQSFTLAKGYMLDVE